MENQGTTKRERLRELHTFSDKKKEENCTL